MKNRIGAGIIAMQRNPSNDVAQLTPKLWYIAVANNGNQPPARDLKNVLAAMAEFACHM